MSKAQIPIKTQAAISLRGLKNVYSYPSYWLLTWLSGLVVLALILWLLNLELLRFVLFESGISLALKIEFFAGVYHSLFTTIADISSMLMVVFAFVFGVNISLIVFVIKRRLKEQKAKHTSTSFLGLGAATISGGCAACGTSLVAPLFASLGVTAAFIDIFSTVALSLAVLLIIYSIFKFSQQAAALK